jgi:PIN domain nuclease of toxin-antitoxin system
VFLAGCGTEKTAPPPTEKADRIIVEKSAHTMTLMHGDEVLKTYKVALSRDPVGPKE